MPDWRARMRLSNRVQCYYKAKYKVLALVVIVGASFFFYRLYHNDVKALTGLSASYKIFDKAISDFSIGETGGLESTVNDALGELNTKAAAFRISSLIKNDATLMDKAHEIGDYSGKELENLKDYKRAIQAKNADLDGLAKTYGDLTSKRKAAYARFQELAGLKD
jgi:hypothetical protein